MYFGTQGGAKWVPDDTVLDLRLAPLRRKYTYVNNDFRT